MSDVTTDPVPADETPLHAETDARIEAMVEDVASEFVAALVNGRIYFAEHPRVRSSIEALEKAVARLLEAIG